MPLTKNELRELARPFKIEIQCIENKIWVNRTILGGRFTKCFIDIGRGEESFHKFVAEWIKNWGPKFAAFDVTEESNGKRALSHS